MNAEEVRETQLRWAREDKARLEKALQSAADDVDYWIAKVANRGKVVQEMAAEIERLNAELASRNASAEKYRCNNCGYFAPDFGADFCNERNSYIDYYVVSVGCAEWSERHEDL